MPLINTEKQVSTLKKFSYNIPFISLNNSLKEFTWAGCSDNVKYANTFTRKFLDSTNKQRIDARFFLYIFKYKYLFFRALVNLHNYRAGRKVLAANQRRQCKCHGISGSCVTKTCWTVVPSITEFGAILKKKYQKAQQVYYKKFNIF